MMMKNILLPSALLSVLALSDLAQAQSSTAPIPAKEISGSAASSQPVAAAKKTLTDPEIVGVLQAANKAEIDDAQVAKKISKSKPVKDYAEMMIKAHKLVLKDIDNVADKADIKTVDSDIKLEYEKSAKENAKKYKSVSGKELDRQYISSQVAAHQGLLDQIDAVLLPSATDVELKALVTKIRTSVAEHLEKAKALQNSIGTAG